MSVDLPEPIAAYLAAENRHDTGALARCFTEDAVVRDEGQTFKGLADIKQWKAETKKKYQHTVEPLEAVQRDGETIVTTRLTGKRFDGLARYPSTRRRFAGRGQQSHFRRHSKYLTQSTWSHSTLYVGRYSCGEYWAQVS